MAVVQDYRRAKLRPGTIEAHTRSNMRTWVHKIVDHTRIDDRVATNRRAQ